MARTEQPSKDSPEKNTGKDQIEAGKVKDLETSGDLLTSHIFATLSLLSNVVSTPTTADLTIRKPIVSGSSCQDLQSKEDDDEPILLPDQADEYLIKEYSVSLIGKLLNPKKQNVERLIVAMPEQWGMSEKITACELGNKHFLFNFDNEEDLNSVLNQGPFHHNFCMFVLICWEPIVDENYPSMVPFSIPLQGIPLHLCTHQNLEAIGDRLGSRQDRCCRGEDQASEVHQEAPNAKKEGINIKLHYEKLFKHCITCGLMTHEAQDCPMKQTNVMSHPTGHETFFDRVRHITSRGDLRDAGSRVPAGNSRGKDETARFPKDGTSSYSCVQRSAHSSRTSRVPKKRDSRYNPYSSGRNQASTGNHQDTCKEQLWKEKHLRPLKIADQQPRDATSASIGETNKLRSIVIVIKHLLPTSYPQQGLRRSNLLWILISH
ncbi:hypothetical protein IGI04_019585 [Brassica rapa subsp. trilocularis]|uniref:DUF4283 domain-containing protein n=1 Tax=Brassica rapa subsp. trilocularis TaxID=1813537 RepID=A0ABQ7MGA1_BRACM|nr:hypothetical protein IGI04_019585 [Brassica rapa subsp. trilocularis]